MNIFIKKIVKEEIDNAILNLLLNLSIYNHNNIFAENSNNTSFVVSFQFLPTLIDDISNRVAKIISARSDTISLIRSILVTQVHKVENSSPDLRSLLKIALLAYLNAINDPSVLYEHGGVEKKLNKKELNYLMQVSNKEDKMDYEGELLYVLEALARVDFLQMLVLDYKNEHEISSQTLSQTPLIIEYHDNVLRNKYIITFERFMKVCMNDSDLSVDKFKYEELKHLVDLITNNYINKELIDKLTQDLTAILDSHNNK